MTAQQRNAAIAAAVIVLLGAVLLLRKGVPNLVPKGPLVKDDLSLTRTFERGEERGSGFLYLPYARTDASARFVNVAVDLNGDGTFAAYDVDGGKQEEWLVRNFAAFASTGAAVGFPVDLPDRSVGGALPAKAAVVFSAGPLQGDAWPATFPDGATVETPHLRSYALADRDALNDREPGGRLERGRGATDAAPAEAAPGATGPATRMDGEPENYSVQHDDVPDQDQRSSECSPTGISDGFRWLAKKYGFEDRMPFDTASLINELKGDLQWDNGVTPGQNTIDGKRAFIARHKLPLEAHLIGEEFDRNIQYKMYQELQKGQAVEAGIAFITPDGKWDGAHLVGVAGVANFGGGDRFINLIDPDEPARTDGGNSEVYRMSGNEVLRYDGTDASRIRFAYAQSPVTDGTGSLVDPAGPKDFVLAPGGGLAEPGGDVTLSRGDFGFFQVAVEHPGDHMVGESFEVRAGVTFTGRSKTIRYFVDKASKSFTFKAGSPWTLKGHFSGNDKVTPHDVLNKPDRKDVTARREQASARFTCLRPGLAKVSYVADLFWTIDKVLPADLPEKYRKQIKNEQIMVVDSPLFRCLAPAPPPSTNSAVAPTPFCPGTEEDPNGVEVPVLRYGNKCYPTPQFHVGQPDNCKATHWHANVGSAVALDGTKTADPNPHECGYGKTTEVPAGVVRLSPDQAAPFIGGVLGR